MQISSDMKTQRTIGPLLRIGHADPLADHNGDVGQRP